MNGVFSQEARQYVSRGRGTSGHRRCRLQIVFDSVVKEVETVIKIIIIFILLYSGRAKVDNITRP